MAEVILGLTAFASVVASLAFLRERDERRHRWRVELLQARAKATEGDAVKGLEERVRRLEQKGLAR